MNGAIAESVPRFWSEESSAHPDRRRIRARIGGLHCSLCTGTIEKALKRQPGVDQVAVSLTHEQALGELRKFAGVQFDPVVVDAFVRTHHVEGVADPGRTTQPRPIPLIGQAASRMTGSPPEPTAPIQGGGR